MAEKILVVEDEPDIMDVVCYNLKQAGFEVAQAENGEAALAMVGEIEPDFILLDLMLPGTDGFEVCRLLKQKERLRDIPVMMLTARAEEVDRIVGLELGADDYMVKPFSPRELVLRVKAILRRTQGETGTADKDERVQAGPLTVDPQAHRVMLHGQTLTLTATEFKLLLTLMQRRGRVQTRAELLNVVWGYEYGVYGRTVDTHIRRLREKLGEAADRIETVRGVGYRFRRENG